MSSRKISRRMQKLRELSPGQTHALFASHVDFPAMDKGRNRLFGAATTFWLFLWQILSSNLSCSETVQNALAWLCRSDGQTASPNTAAFCKARKRLESRSVEKVRDEVAANLESHAKPDSLFPGRRVKPIDGTGLTMADTPANQERFPQHGKQKQGCGFPILRMVAVFSMATGAIVRTAWDSLRVPERTLFHQLWDEFKRDDIVLADRGFCGFADFWVLLQRGVDCVMRKHQRRGAGERLVKKLGKGDCLMAWRKTGACPAWLERDAWHEMPAEMTIRQIDVTVDIPGFRTKKIILVTTLLDSHLFAKEKFAELYRRRWHAELFFRDIKISMGMDVLKCKSPEMVAKELTMYLIAYNLVRTLIIEACEDKKAKETDPAHEPDPLRISFKRTADAIRQWAPLIQAARNDDRKMKQMIENFLYCISRLKIPDRPNRTEPRAIKRRMKNYQLLNKPRHEFKEIPHRSKYKAGLS
jgi:hypothetical protein